MIRLIEVLNYRCLRHVRQPLGPFSVLVGPNASGKSTFLDALSFLGDLVSEGLEAAVSKRTSNFLDLLWGRQGECFEMAVEAPIPEHLKRCPLHAESDTMDTIRFALSVGLRPDTNELSIFDEQLVYFTESDGIPREARGNGAPAADSILVGQHSDRKTSSAIGRTFLDTFPDQFDALEKWLGGLLRGNIHHLEPDNSKLRHPSPPGKGVSLKEDCSNLPWVISDLAQKDPARFNDWLSHLRTALNDLQDVRVVERPEDKHRYLMVRYRSGLEVPSWMLSDGTLRLLALTLLAYLPGLEGLWLIEEPENSMHPLNIETVMQSLHSVYDGQLLVATHSPLVLGLTRPEEILVFSRDEKEGTRIVKGSDHPNLSDWKGEVDLGTLFASGVLG